MGAGCYSATGVRFRRGLSKPGEIPARGVHCGLRMTTCFIENKPPVPVVALAEHRCEDYGFVAAFAPQRPAPRCGVFAREESVSSFVGAYGFGVVGSFGGGR